MGRPKKIIQHSISKAKLHQQPQLSPGNSPRARIIQALADEDQRQPQHRASYPQVFAATDNYNGSYDNQYHQQMEAEVQIYQQGEPAMAMTHKGATHYGMVPPVDCVPRSSLEYGPSSQGSCYQYDNTYDEGVQNIHYSTFGSEYSQSSVIGSYQAPLHVDIRASFKYTFPSPYQPPPYSYNSRPSENPTYLLNTQTNQYSPTPFAGPQYAASCYPPVFANSRNPSPVSSGGAATIASSSCDSITDVEEDLDNILTSIEQDSQVVQDMQAIKDAQPAMSNVLTREGEVDESHSFPREGEGAESHGFSREEEGAVSHGVFREEDGPEMSSALGKGDTCQHIPNENSREGSGQALSKTIATLSPGEKIKMEQRRYSSCCILSQSTDKFGTKQLQSHSGDGKQVGTHQGGSHQGMQDEENVEQPYDLTMSAEDESRSYSPDNYFNSNSQCEYSSLGGHMYKSLMMTYNPCYSDNQNVDYLNSRSNNNHIPYQVGEMCM